MFEKTNNDPSAKGISRRNFLVGAGSTLLLAACASDKVTKAVTSVNTTTTSSNQATQEAKNSVPTTTKPPETGQTTTSSPEKPKNPTESLPNVEFEPGKLLGTISVIAPGTRFEFDPQVTQYYPLAIKFETPDIAEDPVLEGAAGVTYKNPITGKKLAQPGKNDEVRTSALFMHRTHASFHPGNAIDQLKPNAGHQILLHRISKYNQDGTEAEGVDLTFNIIDTGVVPYDDAKQANRVFGEPADPDATDLVIYACSGANKEPGLATHRTYARARLVPTIPPAAPLQG